MSIYPFEAPCRKKKWPNERIPNILTETLNLYSSSLNSYYWIEVWPIQEIPMIESGVDRKRRKK